MWCWGHITKKESARLSRRKMGEDQTQIIYHLVVAKYTEDVQWAYSIKKDRPSVELFIYDKCPVSHHISYVIPRNNKGREAETYLYHIIRHYENLPPYLCLLQGKPFDHLHHLVSANKFLETLMNNPLAIREQQWWFFAVCDGMGRPHHKGLDINNGYQHIFGQTPPSKYVFVAGAQFMLSRGQIYKHQKAFYQHIYTLLENDIICPWVLERLWPYIFGLLPTHS